MSLAPGSRLGPYEIVASIGAGGLGEVYRACDRRLDRDGCHQADFSEEHTDLTPWGLECPDPLAELVKKFREQQRGTNLS
jgi:hypothetical protein